MNQELQPYVYYINQPGTITEINQELQSCVYYLNQPRTTIIVIGLIVVLIILLYIFMSAEQLYLDLDDKLVLTKFCCFLDTGKVKYACQESPHSEDTPSPHSQEKEKERERGHI